MASNPLNMKTSTFIKCALIGTSLPLFAGCVEREVVYRDRLYFQFAAGGFDITRNVVAQRGLGLPR